MKNTTTEEEDKLEIEYDGDPFTMVPNDFVINPSYEIETRLLYIIIKRYITIPNFILYKKTLQKALNVSSNTFDKYWSQLKDLGLLIQDKKHVNGRWKYYYKLLSPSQIEQDPKNWGVVQDPKKQGIEKQEGENEGEFNNNDFNNTYSSNTYLNLESTNEQDELEKMLNSLSSKQMEDLNKLIRDVGTHKLNSSKDALLKYVLKLYKNGFVDSRGRPINSLYGIVHSNFRIKSENDKAEYEIIKKLADEGNPNAEVILHKYYI